MKVRNVRVGAVVRSRSGVKGGEDGAGSAKAEARPENTYQFWSGGLSDES